MRFLLDQDVYALTNKFLLAAGYDVIQAGEIGLAQAKDEDVLKTAHQQNRILITRDRDYGNLVFINSFDAGIIYLRMSPSTISSVHHQLSTLLLNYSEQDLLRAFVVVEFDRYRVRRLSYFGIQPMQSNEIIPVDGENRAFLLNTKS